MLSLIPVKETLNAGLSMTPYTLKVPLNCANPDGASITVFFRIVNDIQRAGAEKLPWLLFLQGAVYSSLQNACTGMITVCF